MPTSDMFFPSPTSMLRKFWGSPGDVLQNFYRVLKGPGVSKGRGCSWGTLRIPFGKIGEPQGTLGKIRGITTPT